MAPGSRLLLRQTVEAGKARAGRALPLLLLLLSYSIGCAAVGSNNAGSSSSSGGSSNSGSSGGGSSGDGGGGGSSSAGRGNSGSSGRHMGGRRADAIFVFGDSYADAGNPPCIGQQSANFLPYGENFIPASGRFSDGPLVFDVIASFLGLPPGPPNLCPQAREPGAARFGLNFAFAGSGARAETNIFNNVSLPVQVREFEAFLASASQNNTSGFSPSRLGRSLFAIVSGTNDYVQFLQQSAALLAVALATTPSLTTLPMPSSSSPTSPSAPLPQPPPASSAAAAAVQLPRPPSSAGISQPGAPQPPPPPGFNFSAGAWDLLGGGGGGGSAGLHPGLSLLGGIVGQPGQDGAPTTNPERVSAALEFLQNAVGFVRSVVDAITTNIETLYSLGARRFVVLGVPALGCLPVTIEAFNQSGCIPLINAVAELHQIFLVNALASLRARLRGASIVEANTFLATFAIATNPMAFGFQQGTNACCGAPPPRNGRYQCGSGRAWLGGPGIPPEDTVLCPNPQDFLFFDSVHWSGAFNTRFAGATWSRTRFLVTPEGVESLARMPGF